MSGHRALLLEVVGSLTSTVGFVTDGSETRERISVSGLDLSLYNARSPTLPRFDPMSKNIADNPANRLLLIVQLCKTIGGNENCRNSWKKVLKADSESKMLDRISKVLDLSVETVNLMAATFPRHVPPLQKLNTQIVSGVTQQNLGGPWSSFIAQISDDSVVALGFAASLLDERDKLKTVDGSEMETHREKLAELRKEVMASDELPEEVRLAIARYLGHLLDALDEYFITGIFPVLDATSTAIGNVAFDHSYGNALRDTTVGQKVAAALANVANSVTIITGMVQLAEPVQHILKSLPAL